MSRPAGAKNRNTPDDDESVFLHNALTEYTFWKKRAKELKEDNEPTGKALEYAEAYKVLLNKFSQLETE